MEFEYADTLQQTITQIAHHYQFDLNDTRTCFQLEAANGRVLQITRMDDHRLRLSKRYRGSDGTLSRGITVVLFTGHRWAPLEVILASGERLVSAVIELDGTDFHVLDEEGYGYLNRGCRYHAREYRRLFLSQIEGERARVQASALPRENWAPETDIGEDAVQEDHTKAAAPAPLFSTLD